MKIVIFGTGGTGAVLGTYLSLTGNDVTFVARGEKLAALKERGLTLKTSHRGDIKLSPVAACAAEDYAGKPDVIFVCVKYYSLPAAVEFVRKAAWQDTLVIPILNVYGTGEIMQKELPDATCLDGCIYVFAHIVSPGVYAQPQSILRVFFGFRPGQDTRLLPKAVALEKILREADIRGHFTDNIRRDALQKFAFVSPMGAAGLYCKAKSDDFWHEGEPRKLFVGLVREIVAIADALGLSFTKDLVETGLTMLDAFKPGLSTSMQRDVAAGGNSEFDGLVTSVVRLGEKLNVPTPLYRKISDWGKAQGIR